MTLTGAADAEPKDGEPSDRAACASPGCDDAGQPDPAVGCHDLVQRGLPVSPTSDPGPLPAMTGGPIADGTYVLTAMRIYGTRNAPPRTVLRGTLAVRAGVMQLLSRADDEPEARATMAFATDGSTILFDERCPVVGRSRSRYSATDATFSMEIVQTGAVATFTRQ